MVQFVLGDTYSASRVRIASHEFPIAAFIRDLNPDPINPYFGRSIIAAAAATVDLDKQMKDWNRNLFANSARPSMIVSTKENLDEKTFERMRQQVSDLYTGTENAHKPFLLEGDAQVTPWMMNQQDLDFLASRKFSRDEILAMFRLSPGMIGQVENVNRANLEAGFYINARQNVLPRVRQAVRQINATLVRMYDPSFELGFVNPVPDDQEAKVSAAVAGVDKWWTKDEARAMFGSAPLPHGLGQQIIVSGKAAVTLESVVQGTANSGETETAKPAQSESADVADSADIPTDKTLTSKANSPAPASIDDQSPGPRKKPRARMMWLPTATNSEKQRQTSTTSAAKRSRP